MIPKPPEGAMPEFSIVEMIGMRWVELEDLRFSEHNANIVVTAAFCPDHTTGRFYLGLAGVFRNVHSGYSYERLLTRDELVKLRWDGKEWKQKQ